jgi:DNA-binding response OmpR family regulator
MRILLAEADVVQAAAAQQALSRAGFAVDWVSKGGDLDESLRSQPYDFIILDLGLTADRGDALVQRIRARQRRVPVIVTTTRHDVRDTVALLDLGVDDYLAKPYDLDELTARIRSVLRRSPVSVEDADDDGFAHGPLRLFPKRHVATWRGAPVPLTQREFWLLEALVRRRNQVLSRAQLEEALYGWGEEIESNCIEVYIHYLRRKFEPALIHTIRGVGYQLAPLRQPV